MRCKLLFATISLCLFISVNAQNWDINLAKSINPRNPNSGVWKSISGTTFVTASAIPAGTFIAALITKDPELKKKSYEVFAALVFDLGATALLKVAFDRTRPADKYPKDIFPYRDTHGKSFPSGHSSMSFAVAASLSIQFKKWYVTVPAYLWAASVGYSRIYLGVHYPSDVIAGAVTGTGSAYLTHWLNKKLFPARKANHSVTLVNEFK